ncbi:MAG: extracellular solute-binding protein [Bacillota bacterium]|nr:extracellular solute-binding protein [Bacillota bacterium]
MKRVPTKILSLVIVVLFLFTLAACQGATTTTTGTTKAPTGTTKAPTGPTTTDTASGRYGKYEETVTVTLLSTDPIAGSTEISYDPNNPDRASANENAWVAGYLEHLNIDIERIIAEDATALNAKINTSMASNDLADIVVCSKEMYYVMAENGVLADLTEAYDSYSSTYGIKIRQAVESVSEDTMNACQYDGEWLALPQSQKAYYAGTDVLWVRQDWLDAVNMDAPTTIDELVDVATAFQENQLGGEDTIGLGVNGIEDCILAAYGAIMNTWCQQDDGTYVYANTMDEMKDGLLKLQEIYAAGLIKSDFAVTNILNEEISNSLVGLFYAPGYYSVTACKSNLLNDEEAEWIAVDIPSLTGEPIKQYTNGVLTQCIVVNKDCENVDALFKMLDFELQMYLEPTKEESAQYFLCDDGYVMWNLRPFRNYGITAQDFYVGTQLNAALANGAKSSDDIPVVAQMIYGLMEPVIKSCDIYNTGVWDGNRDETYPWGIYYVYCISYPIVQAKQAEGLLVAGYNGPNTDNISTYQATINEALTNAMLKVIMGADISVFEEAVQTWYDTGGQAITDDVNAYYQSLK